MSELSATSNVEFNKFKNKGFIRTITNFFSGQPNALLPFDDIRAKLKLHHTKYLGLQEVGLDKIVGSVGRYEDFNREFIPRYDGISQRWRRIYDLTEALEGTPPVDLYKVGDAYFVRDGNHRVSVARANGLTVIEAFVTEYITPVGLSSEDSLDDVLIKVGRTNFLAVTHLDELRPEQDIVLTNPGRYKFLLAHIEVHKYFREVECGCEISYEEAVASWYDAVYLPLVQEIRSRDILQYFPGRTEADLYAWLVLHRAALEEVYGVGQVDTDEIVDELEEEATASLLQKLERNIKRQLDPGSLPPPVE